MYVEKYDITLFCVVHLSDIDGIWTIIELDNLELPVYIFSF